MCHVPRVTQTAVTVATSSNQKVTRNNKNVTKQSEQQKLKNYQIQMDRLFLAACQGIVDNDMSHLHLYINAGGDLARYLTLDEVKLLNRPNVFTVGLTLLHLCYQYKRKEFLITILNKSSNSGSNGSGSSKKPSNTMNLLNALLKQVNKTKFSPCQSCPSLANNIIERYFLANLRQRKTPSSGNSQMQQRNNIFNDSSINGATNATLFTNSPTSSLISLNHMILTESSSSPPPPINVTSNGSNSLLAASTSSTSVSNIGNATSSSPTQSLCYFVNDFHTFTLPNEIEDFSTRIQHVLFDELLDREVQQELEYECRVINWNMDLCKRLNSRLYPLLNRHSGDCLLDSVLQACYGVFDTDNTLRRVMAESLETYANW